MLTTSVFKLSGKRKKMTLITLMYLLQLLEQKMGLQS